MSVITKLEYQQRNKSRVNIYLDGDFACGMPAIVVGEYRLKVGDEIDGNKLAVMGADADKEEAWTRGVDYATRSVRSEREISDYLMRKGFANELIRGTVQKLKFYGYVDDRNYVRAYIADHRMRYGAKKMAYELSSKGVRRELYEPILAEIDGTEACIAIAKKYLAGKSADIKTKSKLSHYLAGKGFDYDAIRAAIETATGETDEFDG